MRCGATRGIAWPLLPRVSCGAVKPAALLRPPRKIFEDKTGSVVVAFDRSLAVAEGDLSSYMNQCAKVRTRQEKAQSRACARTPACS
jgi:hypothetical protein